jgi:anti-anti-sigma factor
MEGSKMETSIRKQGEWTVVKISGRIELEKAHIFREACLKSLKNEKVVFELDRLQFVGSTGMTEFFECLHDIENMKGCGVKLVGLSSDFKRFVAFTKASQLKIHENLEEAFKPQLESNIDFNQESQGHSLEATKTLNLETSADENPLQTTVSEVLQSSDSENY